MEHVKEIIQKAMPSLRSDLVESLMSRLELIGVNCVDDLSFVKTEDVEGILPPIQCRRLIQAFSVESHLELDATSGPLQQNNQPSASLDFLDCSSSWDAYVVPWHKMPPNLMLAVCEKKRPKPKERRELVRIIVDDLLSKTQGRPGRAKLRDIAKQIVEKYPCSFQDRELSGIKVVGSGYDALFIQFENRVENVRRPLTVGSMKRSTEDEMTARKKSSQSDRYGCVQWQPTVGNTTELVSEQEQLKSAFEINSLSESDVRRLMAETYSIQRAAINQGSSVNKLHEEWPFLFEAVHLFDHTCTLLGFSVQTKLAEQLSKKEKTIKDFLDYKGFGIEGTDPFQLICGIAQFFKESPDQLFRQNEQHPDTPTVDLPSTPCILIQGEQLFKVAVDQDIVNNHINSPIVALSYAFSMFYVLNIKYPKEMSLTLEFIQRFFLGINPERGSKAEMKGRKLHIPPRLLKFLNELNDFENPWRV